MNVFGRRMAAAAAAGLLAVGLGSSAAGAANRDGGPVVTHDPEISGQPYVGETLTAVNATWTPSTATATYAWYSCPDTATSDGCKRVGGGQSNIVTAEDLGKRLRVLLTVQSGDRRAYAFSEWTPAITHKPVPTPTPTPTATPTPTPTPVPPPVTLPPASPPPATGGVAGEHQQALRFLSPFPVVRIKGWLTASGARVTMLTVRAPRGSKITVRCRGAHCPRKNLARATSLVHLRPYERLLRGNMRLEISITRRGFVGKRTVIVLRSGKAPTRRDLCLYPGVRRAKSCAAA